MMLSPKILRCILIVLISFFVFAAESKQQNGREFAQDPGFKHIEEFQKVHEVMHPTESFSFDMNQGDTQMITLWPSGDTGKVSVTYYIHNEQNPELVTGKGFFAECYLNGEVFKTFLNQKVGVCIIPISLGPNIIDLRFKSQTSLMTIYVDYENQKLQIQNKSKLSKKSSNVQTLEELNRMNLAQVSEKFEKVKINGENQQTLLRSVLRVMSKNGRRLESNIKYAHHRIIIETLFVILSGVVGMLILKKQLNKGYELLV